LVDPTTTNIALAVPTRGSDPGTWDVPMNSNSNAVDGLFGGVATISLSSTNVTLTAPSATITPAAGPFQSQNRILVFTGALASNLIVTLPSPGKYTIQNLTTGNFVATLAAVGVGNVVATPQGSIMDVWNDGTNVWLIKPTMPGALTFLGGVSAVPAWITACTVKPFLLSDGTVYNFSTYSALGNLYKGSFGGNGITTFAVQDLQGRVPLAFDGTGTRITVAGCGINGQTLGASGGNQTINNGTGIIRSDLPNASIALVGTQQTWTTNQAGIPINCNNFSLGTGGGGSQIFVPQSGGLYQALTTTITPNGTIALNGNVTQTLSNVVQPAQVSGIWLVAT
jgi:microcystin-dependent protein